jgi:hypothetical protein
MTTPIREVAADRHPSVQAVARWLEPNPALPGHLHDVAKVFHDAGVCLLTYVEVDDPELTTALRKLVEAKDCAVRARIVHAEEIGS